MFNSITTRASFSEFHQFFVFSVLRTKELGAKVSSWWRWWKSRKSCLIKSCCITFIRMKTNNVLTERTLLFRTCHMSQECFFTRFWIGSFVPGNLDGGRSILAQPWCMSVTSSSTFASFRLVRQRIKPTFSIRWLMLAQSDSFLCKLMMKYLNISGHFAKIRQNFQINMNFLGKAHSMHRFRKFELGLTATSYFLLNITCTNSVVKISLVSKSIKE